VTTPKLKNNPMEKKAKRELEKMRSPWHHIKEITENLEEHIYKETMCSTRKNYLKDEDGKEK
jgi:hypothetical protein